MATRYRADFGFAGFLVYVRDFLRVCLTDRAVVVSLVVCQLLMLLSMFTCYPMTEEAVYREQAVEMLGIATNTLSTYGSEMPRALLELTERERQHYADAVEAEYPSREYFAAMAAAKSVEYEMWRAGYSTGGVAYAACAKMLEGLAGLSEPKVYKTAAELPAFEYLALAVGAMPAICALLPALVATSRITLRLRGRGLLGRAPIGRMRRWVGAALASAACTALSPPTVVLPATVVSLVRNGIGDPTYPVVHVIGGEVVAKTAGTVLLEDAALLGLAGISICLLMCLVSRAKPAASLATGLAVVLLPLLPFYSLDSAPWASVGSWLPTTYLNLDQVIGHLTYANGGDIAVFSQTTFERGIVVLGCTITVVCLATIGTGALARAHDKRRLRKGGAR